MSEQTETALADLPGTVWAAAGLSALTALVGLFFPPWGWVCTMIYGAGAIGLIGLRAWGYWLVVIASGLSFLTTLMSGRLFIGTTMLILILLVTRSARTAFEIGHAALPD